MKIFDISRPLFNGLAPWPGDTAFLYELKWKMAEGATVNVGAVTMGVHNGSHADAPFHFQPGADTIERMPLETYFGEAVVVDLTNQFKDGTRREITIADLGPVGDLAVRVLLKTGVWKDSQKFPEWIPVIASDVPKWLEDRKVKLLGLDLPSVDTIEAKVLVNHHALAAANIAIVESLDLSEIEAGTYHFSALPLRISGGDAAPVRAILWRD
ncbi:MAG TPA: cyclase family protein [Chthoniobacterales bacterium]|jgi:arylformamidase|nr:cyclase family protein [Chthoniobacterales bacterium]